MNQRCQSCNKVIENFASFERCESCSEKIKMAMEEAKEKAKYFPKEMQKPFQL